MFFGVDKNNIKCVIVYDSTKREVVAPEDITNEITILFFSTGSSFPAYPTFL
jgi:hypothetical protein